MELPPDIPEYKSDNRILKVCLGLSEGNTKQVILVTKDILLRIKAQLLGIQAEDFTTEQVAGHEEQYLGRKEVFVSEELFKDFKKKGLRIKAQLLGIQAEDFTTEQVAGHEEQYLGRKEVFVSEELFKDFKKKGVPVEHVYCCDSNGTCSRPELFENEFVILKADQSSKKTQLGRVEKGVIRKLEYRKATPYGVTPRNAGQYFLQEALMQPAEKAPLVIVKGMAGTSKTFYSLAVGLEKVLNNPSGEYRRILICRPNALFDSDIGFLPGDEQEKISPLMRPIMDNLEQLVDSNDGERYSNEQELQDKVQEIFDRGLIQTEALTFIRGRSIIKTYLIIDEAQNMTPAQIKGIITRAGAETKIVLLGDPNQIDRPYLDDRTNGLSYAAEHMKGSPLCWQITLLLRIKAQLLGIQAEDFTTEQVAGHEEQYLGRKEVFVSEELFKDFKKKGVPVEHVYSNDGERYSNEQELQDKVQEIFDRGLIQTEALTFIRGRSIIKTYLIIDEAQNMTPAQIKGIIIRAGAETKIVLLGDPNQIDRPYLDDRTNGLSYAAEHMKGSPLCWQITLLPEECERSALATEAIRCL